LTDLIFNGSPDCDTSIVLAHGAGAPMDSPFMDHVAAGLAAAGYRVARFEFPYMAGQRADGLRRGPDRPQVLVETWRSVLDTLGTDRTIIGGKSMGGRIASVIADDCGVLGLLCLGYPFHPPGHPERTRTDHLATLRTPTLICQGSRDPLGARADVASYDLSAAIRLHWLEDGDHSFKPRKMSGRTEAQNLDEAVAAAVTFIRGL
jgi:predicted alpha/beta-hydrolase family hydrolase